MIAIPVIFLTLSTIEASLAMWQFHTMQYAIELVDRYVTTHGRGCTQNGNACSLTVGNVASMIVSQARALDPAKLNITLTTHSSTTTCAPVNTCLTSTTQFPNATDNGVNLDVTIAATYPISAPMPMVWPGAGSTSSVGTFTLGATTRQRILF